MSTNRECLDQTAQMRMLIWTCVVRKGPFRVLAHVMLKHPYHLSGILVPPKTKVALLNLYLFCLTHLLKEKKQNILHVYSGYFGYTMWEGPSAYANSECLDQSVYVTRSLGARQNNRPNQMMLCLNKEGLFFSIYHKSIFSHDPAHFYFIDWSYFLLHTFIISFSQSKVLKSTIFNLLIELPETFMLS